jgi:hypothetical protein
MKDFHKTRVPLAPFDLEPVILMESFREVKSRGRRKIALSGIVIQRGRGVFVPVALIK